VRECIFVCVYVYRKLACVVGQWGDQLAPDALQELLIQVRYMSVCLYMYVHAHVHVYIYIHIDIDIDR